MLACPEKPYVKVRHMLSFFVDFWAFLIDYLEVCKLTSVSEIFRSL